MFDRVQVRAMPGSLKDSKRPVPKPLLCCFGCVLRVVVLLEGEPSPQSEVLSALEQVFIKDLSILLSVHLSPILTSLQVPATEKTSPQHDAATTMLHRRDGARFPSDVMLDIQSFEFYFGFFRPEKLVSHGLSPLGDFWQTPSGLSCAFY